MEDIWLLIAVVGCIAFGILGLGIVFWRFVDGRIEKRVRELTSMPDIHIDGNTMGSLLADIEEDTEYTAEIGIVPGELSYEDILEDVDAREANVEKRLQERAKEQGKMVE